MLLMPHHSTIITNRIMFVFIDALLDLIVIIDTNHKNYFSISSVCSLNSLMALLSGVANGNVNPNVVCSSEHAAKLQKKSKSTNFGVKLFVVCIK